MGLQNLIAACTLLFLCNADQNLRTVNSMLDPNRVTWWRSKWAPSPIQLSTNNANQALVTATFYFCPTTSITSGVVEITFPSSAFSLPASSGSQTVNGQVVSISGQTLVAGQDTTVQVTGITNPSQEGAHGPFAIRTRSTLNGQQMDVNLSFGCIYIRPIVGVITGATATIVGAPASGTVINKGSNTISFKFTISVSLWRFDLFVINLDNRWTISTGATCSSADYTGKWNNFNGTTVATASNVHNLNCYITQTSTTVTSQTAYIYGLAVDGIDTTVDDNKYVDLRITSVTSPNAQYSGHPYSWTITTCRFGTTTFLEQASITSGPTVNTDVPGAVTWAPTWGTTIGEINAGSTYFMDMSITLTNPVPLNAANYIEIVMTETPGVITGSDSCYIITYLSRTVTCTVTTKTLKLSPLPALTASSVIKIRNYVTVSSSAGTGYISSVKSFLTSSAPIDVSTSTSMGAISIVAASTLTGFTMFTMTTSGVSTYDKTGGNGLNTFAIEFNILTGATIGTDTTVTIGCPFATSLDDFAIGVPTSTVSYSAGNTSVSTISAVSTTALTANKPTFAAGTSTTLGTLTFTGAAATFTNGAVVSVFQAAGTTTPFITLPRVATNIATAYECRATAVKTGSTYRGVLRFSVAAQVFTDVVTVGCLDNINGMPWVFDLVPTVHKITASSSDVIYYVEIQFTSTGGNFASGLTVPAILTGNTDNALDIAVSYPMDKSGVSSSPTAWAYNNGSTTTYLAVKDVGEIATSATTAKFIFPIGGLTPIAVTGITPTYRSYFVYSSTKDPRYKYITHEETLGTGIVISAEASNDWSAAHAVISGTTINWDTTSAGVTLNLADASLDTSLNKLYYVVFPMGYKFASAAAVKKVTGAGTSTVFPVIYTFSSPTWGFKFPGVFFTSGPTGGTAVNLPTAGDATNGTLNISGYQVRPGSTTDNQDIKAVFGGTGTGVCDAISTGLVLVSNEGSISNVSTSPLALKTKGPDGINVTQTVTFTLAHGILAGGKIVLTYNSAWTTSLCTKCTVSGLTILAGVTQPCTVLSNVATVIGFAEFLTANTAITITITGLISPTSAGTYAFVSSIVSQVLNQAGVAGTFYTVDSVPASATLSSATSNAVVVTASTDVGKTTWATTKKVIPSTVSATSVDLYLKFSLTHALYKTCGTITLTSPYSFASTAADCKNYVFFSLAYSTCAWTGSTLTLTLDQDYTAGASVELFVDAAVTNPSTTTASSTGFSISTFWSTVQVDLDTTTSQLTYSATAQPTTSITGSTTSSLTFSPKNAGEVATYTFSFKDTAAYATTDQFWIVFPKQYDYFLGDTWQWFSKESNTYYIDCASTQLGTTWCTVDHGIVVVSGSNAITGSVEIVLTISGVINPAAAQTDSFQIYHMDSTGEVKSIQQSFGTVTPTALATDMGVRSLDQTDRRIFKASDYKWRLYVTDVLTTESQLKVQFPREFDLNKFDKKDSYSCSTTYQDISATATDKSQRSWNSASSCTASNNWVTLSAPATQTTFTATNIVTWTLQSVMNPQWGMPRTQLDVSRDHDVYDAVLWPLDPLWASRFNFFVYQSGTANQKYSTRSYQNTNAAYAGFTRGYRQILVNGFVPLSKTNRIVVYAGTQTKDINIATESTALPMAAKQIVFTPSTNSRTPDSGKLKYTSVVDEWTLFQSFYYIQFRVAAAYDMIKGLYYIDWSNNETKQSGLNDVQYDTPASTLVEVVALVTGYSQLTVSAIPNISTGYTSVPIKITAAYSPHSDVTVNIAVVNTPANISITPTAVTFSPDVDSKYFQIQVASNYDIATLGATQTLSFTLTGTDKDAFTISATAKFTITQPSTTVVPGSITTFGLTPTTRTTVSFSPSTDQYGVVYFQIAAKGTTVPTYSSLKSAVNSLVGTNSTNSSPGVTEGANTESDPQTGETWKDFQWRLYKAHLTTVWVGAVSMYATTAVQTTTIDWLWAGTDYQIAGYLDNLSSSSADPTAKIEYFTTTATPDYQPIVVKYEGTVASSYLSRIAQEYSNLIGVNPLRMDAGVYANPSSRQLQTTTGYSTFTYSLLPNRFTESPTPADQSKLSTTQQATLSANLKTAGINNNFSGVTTPSPVTRTIPTWASSPASGGSTTNSVTVTLRSSVAGQSCCVATTGSTTSPTSEQVMLGLDATNEATSSTCISTDISQTSNSIQIAGLQAGTTYYVYCTAVDSYPLWPAQMSFSTTNPIQPVSITTLSTDATETDGASYFGGLFLLFLLH